MADMKIFPNPEHSEYICNEKLKSYMNCDAVPYYRWIQQVNYVCVENHGHWHESIFPTIVNVINELNSESSSFEKAYELMLNNISTYDTIIQYVKDLYPSGKQFDEYVNNLWDTNFERDFTNV